MDLSDIIASSIHDIKNSLGVMLGNLDALIDDPGNHIANRRQANALRQEIRRANRNLIQLLILYKLNNKQICARLAEYNIDELLQDIVADNIALCQSLSLTISARCDPDLAGFFDLELVRGVLDSTVGNATRYAKSEILLTAEPSDGGLVFRVMDDGEGFPEAVLELQPSGHQETYHEHIMSGRTGLGFYFAGQIAELHKNKSVRGHVVLRNNVDLTGGCFEMHLP